MQQRHVPEEIVKRVHEDPDYRLLSRQSPDREIRGRHYDDQVIEIVIDTADESVVTVWVTRLP